MAIHYICDGCSKRIFPVTARFHCLVCADYDSCQACHMAGRFSAPHEAPHPFHIIYVPSPVAAASQPGTAAVVAPIPPPLLVSAATATIPPPPPPQFKSPLQPPPLPPRKPPSQAPPAVPSPNQYWGSLITPQKTASPLLCRFADATFAHFSAHTQTLTPEQLSSFYTAMGRAGSANFPQLFQSLMAQFKTTLDPADGQIAFVFREYEYEHVMTTRAATEGYEPVLNGMPLLMREGFRKMLLDEVLEGPDNAWVGFNTLLGNVPTLVDPATGKIFEHWSIPRGCFPREVDPEARAKGDRISAALVERSEIMFEALAKAMEEEKEKDVMAPGVAEIRRREEELRATAEAEEQLAAVRARIEMEQYGQDNILGGWRVDSWGNRYYDEGLI